MAVRFQPFGYAYDSGAAVHHFTSLHGRPFPTEEIEALWALVPGDWIVDYVPRPVEQFSIQQRAGYGWAQLSVQDAFELSHWQRVFADLSGCK